MAVIQSLFGDMLPATMQDGVQGGRGGLPRTINEPQPVMTQQPQPVMTQPQVDLNNLDLSFLDNLNLPKVDQNGMFDFTSVPNMGQQQAPQNPTDFFNQYTEFLSGVQSGNTANKVNRRDDIYNNFFNQTNYRYQGNPADFRASVGLSDAFSVYDNPEVQINAQSFQEASQALTGASDPLSVLSNYYGFDIVPTANEGANYRNAQKYGTTEQNMAEFQSIIEPILQKTIPYIQATQGLEYTDALEYAYTHDPMVAALYNQYGVDLYRSTDDGSTYIFDPIAGQEIRTLEVKDPKFKDFLPAIALSAVTAGAGSLIGGAISNTALGASLGTAGSNALGSAVAGIGSAAASGKRGSDLITAGVLSGLGGYTKGLNEIAQTAAAGSQVAIDAAAKADIFNNVLKVANAADAIANKNYFKLLNMGLEAGGFESFNTLTANKLNELGGADGTLLGLNVDQLAPAVNNIAKDLLTGKDLDDALKGGVLEYIKQGGALDRFNLKDFNFPSFDFNTPEGIKGIEDFVKTNWSALKDSSFVQGMREVGRNIDDDVIQPLIEPIKGLDQELDDLIKTPDSVKAIEDYFKSLEGPDINFPDLNLDLPFFGGGATDLLGMSTGGGYSGMDFRDPNLEVVQPAELFGYVDYLAQLTGRPQ